MAKYKEVIKGMTYGSLTAKWFWSAKNGERIWKCTCVHCGNAVYVRERGLLFHLADHCGCKS